MTSVVNIIHSKHQQDNKQTYKHTNKRTCHEQTDKLFYSYDLLSCNKMVPISLSELQLQKSVFGHVTV